MPLTLFWIFTSYPASGPPQEGCSDYGFPSWRSRVTAHPSLWVRTGCTLPLRTPPPHRRNALSLTSHFPWRFQQLPKADLSSNPELPGFEDQFTRQIYRSQKCNTLSSWGKRKVPTRNKSSKSMWLTKLLSRHLGRTASVFFFSPHFSSILQYLFYSKGKIHHRLRKLHP